VSDKIVTVGLQTAEISLERDGNAFRAGGHVLEVLATREDELEIRVDGRVSVLPYVVQGTTISFAFEGEIFFADVSEKGGRAKARHRDHSTEAPMPGAVLKILVRPGDVVKRGAPLLILEAMKMEHQIVAPRDGTIATVSCREGELVQPGIELVTLKEE
jgi:3-methylcrotonyl-CoA carboxylase alpha subunit